MLFNSYEFMLLFLPIVLLFWWSPKVGLTTRLVGLTLASYLFYGWWDYRFVGLLMLSTVVDYFAGKRLHESTDDQRRRFWLGVSLASNLGLLAFFKYCGFFAESWNAVADWLRTGGSIPVPQIILPVGISFYTFQTLSYSIDIFRREAEPARSFWHFAAYVSLFPQLIAGPIVRYGELEEQLANIPDKVDWDRFAYGIFFFVGGMAQKLLLADIIAEKINPLLVDYSQLQLVGSWYAMLGYSLQLYFDFAGYSNMAVGLGMMLGFSFPQNFNSPYCSNSIADFWRRWHMTLSFWLRDYLFIPLGGSRRGNLLTLRNLVIVMFLGGLWHGAGWTFVVWGLFHGCLLGAHATLRRVTKIQLPRLLSIAITFVCVVFGWAIFRSTDMTMAMSLWESMLGLRGIESDLKAAVQGVTGMGLLSAMLAICWFAPNMWSIRFRPNLFYLSALSFTMVICVLRFDSDSPFLYFQF